MPARSRSAIEGAFPGSKEGFVDKNRDEKIYRNNIIFFVDVCLPTVNR
jgi:hypothetical protein